MCFIGVTNLYLALELAEESPEDESVEFVITRPGGSNKRHYQIALWQV